MRDQPRISEVTAGIRMVYSRKGPDQFERKSNRSNPRYEGTGPTVYKTTSLPMAIASWVLDSIDFIGMVNSAVAWDAQQCKVSPGDAVKAMVMTMVMSGYRPALENVNTKFMGQPLNLYFDSVTEHTDLSPDMLARTLTKLHQADAPRLFMAASAAMRSHWGIRTRAVHSDTTSISVYGEYERYDSEGRALIVDDEGNLVPDPMDTMHITYGYSKDYRPDLKQYMIGCVVDENGIPMVSKPLDGNTADSKWNAMCLELMDEVLREEHLVYVADSKLVNSKLVNSMMDNGIWFLSRCPKSYDGLLLEETLMAFDLDDLKEVPPFSPAKNAATRRVAEVPVEQNGETIRAIIVETSTLVEKGELAVEKARRSFETSLSKFDRTYSCEKDTIKAFEKFRKKHSKGIFDISATYVHDVVESRPRGRPRADGTDIRRADRYTIEVHATLNPERAEALRRVEGYIMLLSNVPTPEKDPEQGLSTEDLARLYSKEWKVEAMFKTKKRPILVERLFIKDPGRADALVNVVNIAALVRAMIQLLLRRGLEHIADEELPRIGYGLDRLQRNVTADFFVDSCTNCYIQYSPVTDSYRFLAEDSDIRARSYLEILDIQPDSLFSH